MSFDSKQLSEQGKIKTLLITKLALERKLQKIQEDKRCLEHIWNEEKQQLEKLITDSEELKADITNFDSIEIKDEQKA